MPTRNFVQRKAPLGRLVRSERVLPAFAFALSAGCSSSTQNLQPVRSASVPLAHRPSASLRVESPVAHPVAIEPRAATRSTAVPPSDPLEQTTVKRVSWLSPEHVSEAVRAQHGAFSACRTLAGTSQEATGNAAITLGWSVAASGRVNAVALDRSSFETPQVNDCMLSVAREVRFPASPTSTQVSWTVRFRGSNDAQVARVLDARP